MSNKTTSSITKVFIAAWLFLTPNISCKAPKKQNTNEKDFQNVKSHLVAQDSIIKLGQHTKSEKRIIPFQFILTNEDDSITVINDIDVSCGCISITSKAKAIRPKESIVLKGFVNPTSQIGHLSKAIFVNYGKGELLTLRVTADIE